MARKSFTPDKSKEEFKEFELYDYVFHAKPRLSSKVLEGFAVAMGGSAKKDKDINALTEVLGAVNDLFKASLIPQDYARWQQMRDSDDEIVDVEMLVEIGSWLAEEYSGGRPTGASSSDGSGSSPSLEDASTAGAPHAALIYTRSEENSPSLSPSIT